MDFNKVIKDNELEDVSSVELISMMSALIDMLKERIDEDEEETDIEIEFDDMDTDELCELATAVMMVLSERVDGDKDETDEINESSINEAVAKGIKALFGIADDVGVVITKGNLARALDKIPKASNLRKTSAFTMLQKYATGKKGLPANAFEMIKNSGVDTYLQKYGSKAMSRGAFKPIKNVSKVAKAGAGAADDLAKAGGGVAGAADDLAKAGTGVAGDGNQVVQITNNINVPGTGTRSVRVNTNKPVKVSKSTLKKHNVEPEKLKEEAGQLYKTDPDALEATEKYGPKAGKKVALIKGMLKYGVPIAAITGGAVVVNGLFNNDNGMDDQHDDLDSAYGQPNQQIPGGELNQNMPNHQNQGGFYIDPSSIQMYQDGSNNTSNNTSNNNGKPNRIKYAGLGDLFNNIGSVIDDTGTKLGSGLGSTIGGFVK